MLKYSRQREEILKDLQSRRDHPTADMVYESVRRKLPNISLGTVYRNLSLLADSGQILKISTGIGPDCFDGFISPHNHFICKCCKKVIDIDYVSDEDIIANMSKTFKGSVEEYELKFFGKCKDCLSGNE
jgi:Fur family peroxide stress response transcriptional regulator